MLISRSRSRSLAIATFAALLSFAMVASDVYAQRGGGGGAGGQRRGGQGRGGRGGAPMTPEELEQAKKAWDLQAKTVMGDLMVTGAKADAVVAAYVKARTDRQAADEKISADMAAARGGGGTVDFLAMQTARTENETKAKTAIETVLKAQLTEEQATKAMGSLGTQSIEWDGMTRALVQIELTDAKRMDASKAVLAYIVPAEKARAEALAARGGGGGGVRGGGGGVRGGGGGRGGRGGAVPAELTAKLNTDLGAILSAEQMTQFQQLSGGRRGRGRG